MGTWGAGNFDSDYAGDHLAALTHGLLDEVRSLVADRTLLEPDELGGVVVPCNIEILTIFAERKWVGVALPTVEEAKGWKLTFMEVWEEKIVGLAPPGSPYTGERRAILCATFDRLIERSRSP